MKKTLIALAALAVSGAAFAQSSVSITGNADVGYAKSTGGKAAFVHGGLNSTPAVFFNIVEDLGGGMRAQAFYEINPNLVTPTMAKSQAYVGLTAGFGTVRLGTPNTALVTTQADRTPFGTALGSHYAAGSLGLGNTAASNTRMAGALQYRSPAIGGFGIVIDHGPATATAKANNIVTISGSVAGIKLNYSNSQNHMGSAEKRNDFSAQAKIAGATLYLGHGKSNAAGAEAFNTVGVMYPMGAISLRGSMAKQGDDSSTTVGVQYDLSKRTNVYAKFAATEKAGKDINTTAFGLRHSF